MLLPRSTDRRHAIGRLACLLIVAVAGASLLGTFLILGTTFASDQGPDLVTADLVKPGETATVLLYADSIATWQVGDEQAVLLRGKVWIEQGLVSLRLEEGVVWISEKTDGSDRTRTLDIYGEGSAAILATLEEGTSRRTAPKIRLHLGTSGEVKIKTFVGKIQPTNRADDPLFKRALAQRNGTATADAPRNDKQPPEAPKPQGEVLRTLGVTEEKPSEAPKPQGEVLRTLGVTPDIAAPANLEQTGFQVPPGTTLPPPPQPDIASPDIAPMQVPIPPPQPVSNPFSEPSTSPRPTASNSAMGAPIGIPFEMTTIGVAQTVNSQSTLGMPAPAAGQGIMTVQGPDRIINIRSGISLPFNLVPVRFPTGETGYAVTSPIIVTVTDALTKKVILDMEAERIVIWDNSTDSTPGVPSSQGQSSKWKEFYLAGNVQIRNQTGPNEIQILRAEEVFYDIARSVAVALKADVEFQNPKTPYPAHFKADVLIQDGKKRFEAQNAEFSVPGLASDPGLKVVMPRAVLEEFDRPRTNIFGIPYYNMKTHDQVTTPQRTISGENGTIQLESIPIFYFFRLKTDANKPLGPLESIGFGYNRIFGVTLQSTWDVFDIFGIVPEPGKKWDLYVDELTARGPVLGMYYRDAGKDFLGLGGTYEFSLKMYGMDDHGTDILGGNRGTEAFTGPNTFLPVNHPELRGWANMQFNLFDLPYGFQLQAQYAQISDRNYLEQYYQNEWLTGPNQETFFYLKQQQDFWAWSFLVEQNIRPWITETNNLPRLDGWIIGKTLFNCLTVDTHGSAGYYQLKPNTNPSFDYLPTDVAVNTGRLDWWTQISTVFSLGDVKVMPYAILDLAYYSQDIAGNEIGRVYGGGGIRASVPFSKLYSDMQSELFNVNGIYHKINLTGNYFYSQTNVHYNQLPQLDQLNGNAENQALNDIFPQQSVLNPGNAVFLTTSKLFDPQMYAVRTLLFSQIDTLDDIDVLQLDLRQRWQTKRGFPGSENVVDWMVLDLSMSIFPQSSRDNFGRPVGLLQYDWLWNVGDRTALFSNGWFEPEAGGPRVFTFGTSINRPDRSSFTLSYRQIDPLNSKAVIGSITYPLSAKYAITGSALYDFGVNTQVNSIMLTRIGTDIRCSFGFSYNSILNSFGVMLEIVPNLFPNSGHGMPGMAPVVGQNNNG